MFIICIFYLLRIFICMGILLGDEIKKNGMGGTCGADGRKKRAIHGFGVET